MNTWVYGDACCLCPIDLLKFSFTSVLNFLFLKAHNAQYGMVSTKTKL